MTLAPTTRPHLSAQAVLALLFGVLALVAGVMGLGDTGSDFSDLLTLAFFPLGVLAILLGIRARRVIRRRAGELCGVGLAVAAMVLAVLGALPVLLIPFV